MTCNNYLSCFIDDRQTLKDLAQTSAVDAPDTDGNTPLMYAAIAGHTKV